MLVAVVLVGLSLGLWFAFSVGPREPDDAVHDETAPAAIVEPEATPEPQQVEPEVEPKVAEVEEPSELEEPEARVEPKKRPRAKQRKDRPAAAPPETKGEAPEDCGKIRAAAQRANKRGAPRTVLRATRNPTCWKGSEEERIYLRTQALLDVHDYDRCAKQGRHAKDPETLAFVRICEAKLKDSP